MIRTTVVINDNNIYTFHFLMSWVYAGQVLSSQSSLSVQIKHMIAISDHQEQATVDTIFDAIRCLLL